MKRFKISIQFLIILTGLWVAAIPDSFAQNITRYTISGYVYEQGSRETLIGVNVYEPRLKTGTVSNTYGFYALTLPSDSVELIFSYVGYQPQIHKFLLKGNIRLDLELSRSVDLEEVVITDEYVRRISQSTQMSKLEIPMQQAMKIPSFMGEKDLFKVLQLMPGVQSGTEGTSGFYVRGGGADQNLIILDDATVYNANHLFGFFSVFNGDAVKNMQLYKGGFPARFGGRLSSVLDIQMKDGDKQKFRGETGIGLISSRLLLEGPILKNKASFLLSGRRTYLDVLMRPFMPKDVQGGYYFYDLNAKINYDLDKNNRIFVSGYFGRDKFFIADKYSDGGYESRTKGGLYWQNATTTVRWNRLFNQRLFGNASFIFSDYNLSIFSEDYYKNIQDDYAREFLLNYSSGIRDFGLKYDLSWMPLPNHHIRAGIHSTHHSFNPYALILKDEDISNNIVRKSEAYNSLESGLYMEDEISVSPSLKINPGIRLSHFYTEKTSYQNIEPRFSSNLILAPDLSWKASFASMNQYLHLLSTTGIGLPTDLWVPSTSQIKPQKTWQVATGFAYDWTKPKIEFSIEGYYKRSRNVIAYKPGATFLLLDDPSEAKSFTWQDKITSGEGWAYGLELLMHRKTGRLSGWVGYTLSWVKHNFEEINSGETFYAHNDRRHDISVVGIFEISPKTTFSATWVFSSGNPYDLAIANYPIITHTPYNPDMGSQYNPWLPTVNVPDKKGNFRAENYHRLDIGFQFHDDMKIFGAPMKRTIEVGAYNAYSRSNPFFYFWDRTSYSSETEFKEYRKLKKVSIFPIIPSITFNYKF